MSVYQVPVVIGIDEERIAKEIENNVERQVVNKITEEVKSVIFEKKGWGDPKEPLREMVRKEIVNVLDKYETLIINTAAEKLADKLSRTKAVREKAAAVAEEVLG